MSLVALSVFQQTLNMGYHIIILSKEQDDIEHHYVEKINELENYSLNKNSIIYEGQPEWAPEMLKHSKKYGNFSFDWHRVGIKAQELFKNQAIEKNYMIEELSQDQDSLCMIEVDYMDKIIKEKNKFHVK